MLAMAALFTLLSGQAALVAKYVFYVDLFHNPPKGAGGVYFARRNLSARCIADGCWLTSANCYQNVSGGSPVVTPS
jgi:hypothetical protein